MTDQEIIKIVEDGYMKLYGHGLKDIVPLPRSGSDRRYFRIFEHDRSIIGAFNANREENDAFIGFTYHFRNKNLPVPEIYGTIPEEYVYFLQDLGNLNLYTWLKNRETEKGFDHEAIILYRKILEKLVLFQTKGIDGLDLDLCYPHKSFDRQSMMWDMNYFKYMFLKLVAAPFNEKRLEHDFNNLADFLLEAGQEYFLYRDFQTANVMVIKGEPWFIDYQGGRRGAPQYDVASLLNDAKIHIESKIREQLLEYYIDIFCHATGENREKFRRYYAGFCMIRLMQALGAFGFRGLYEQKPTFTESIVPGVKLLQEIISWGVEYINLPELFSTVRSVSDTEKFRMLTSVTDR